MNQRGSKKEDINATSIDAPASTPTFPSRRGDEPPELTDEDEEILDRIWARLGEEESKG
jgi:hypothetical protein